MWCLLRTDAICITLTLKKKSRQDIMVKYFIVVDINMKQTVTLDYIFQNVKYANFVLEILVLLILLVRRTFMGSVSFFMKNYGHQSEVKYAYSRIHMESCSCYRLFIGFIFLGIGISRPHPPVHSVLSLVNEFFHSNLSHLDNHFYTCSL